MDHIFSGNIIVGFIAYRNFFPFLVWRAFWYSIVL